MEGFMNTVDWLVIGYRHQGPFEEYPHLVKRAFDELSRRLPEIPGKTGRTVAVYEPHRGSEHREGFFYVGCIVEAEQEAGKLPADSERLRLRGTYACAEGTVGNMAGIYEYVGRWMAERGHRGIYPDALFVELYELPIPQGEIKGSEPVRVMMPVETEAGTDHS